MEIVRAELVDVEGLAELNKGLIEDERHPNPMDVAQLTKRMREWLSFWRGRPARAVECKAGAPRGFGHLRYFAGKLGIEQRYWVTASDRHDYLDRATGVRVVPAGRFLMALV